MIRLDLSDIQGNIVKPYGRSGFPFTRHLFFTITDPLAGRRFVQTVRPRVTTADPWDPDTTPEGQGRHKKPAITLNLGFSYAGLKALDLPTRTLRLLPDEFIDGMRCRNEILGDVGGSDPDGWDPAWREGAPAAHIWVSLNVGPQADGTPTPILQEWTDWLIKAAKDLGGVQVLTGHGSDGAQSWQDSAALTETLPDGRTVPCAREHFGFTDGISDPVFKGQYGALEEQLYKRGGGKLNKGLKGLPNGWEALDTGEFILGHVDEGQELPVATQPAGFMRNGSFMVWRKLQENVEAFKAYVEAQAGLWMQVTGETDKTAARETLMAKMVGRWSSGIPLMVAPTWADHQRIAARFADVPEILRRKAKTLLEKARLVEYELMLTDFRYGDDLDGAKCPFGSHIRRANPRDMLDPILSAHKGSTTLVNRRRIIRRGLPYQDATGEKGVIFMAGCASIFRQFEFVQQQWVNYGLDFEAGNDTCPLVGNRAQATKLVIPAGAAGEPPFIAANLPEFVTTRGGEYFFLPSLSAIRMIAMGMVDPT